MLVLQVLLVLPVLVYSLEATCDFDGCPEVTTDEAVTLFQSGLFGEGNPSFVLGPRVPNCLAVGRVRDRYRFATYTAQFSSSRFPGELRFLQVDLFCSPSSNAWQTISNAVILNGDEEDRFNASLRTDCSMCSSSASGADPITSCVDCADECTDDGLDQCCGISQLPDECCNFYFQDICVAECPNNFTAIGPDFNCECALECQNGGEVSDECDVCNCVGNYQGENCEICGIDCVYGTVDEGCTVCTCIGGFTGDDCSICPLTCMNDGTPNNNCTKCDCVGGFEGDDCGTCPLNCTNGGTLNSNCTTCNCLPNFGGDECENCMLPNCAICSMQVGECLVCFEGFSLNDNNQCVINCSRCDLLQDETQQNVCRYFCQLEAWRSEAIACGLDIPVIEEPDYTASAEALYQMAVAAGELVDPVWASAANELSVEAAAPDYQSTTEEWVGIAVPQFLINFDNWQQYIVAFVDPEFPTVDLSNILTNTSDANSIYNAVQSLWLESTIQFTNRIAIQQCPV